MPSAFSRPDGTVISGIRFVITVLVKPAVKAGQSQILNLQRRHSNDLQGMAGSWLSHLDLFLALVWEIRILRAIFIVMLAWLNFPERTAANCLWTALVYDVFYILDIKWHR